MRKEREFDTELIKEAGALVGKKIKEMRAGVGLSQVDLAHRMRIAQAELSRIENGRRHGSLYRVMQAARLCGYDLEVTVKKIGVEEDDGTEAVEA